MDGLWFCEECESPTSSPKTRRLCAECDKEVKSLGWKLGQAKGALKRIKKIAYPRPEVTDIIDKVLKRL